MCPDSKHGVLHDDDVHTSKSYNDGGKSYGDNLDCGVRIRAGKGGTVNLHIVQMNLEGDGNGICDPHSPHYIGHSCDGNGGDFLSIYDGRNKNAKLLAKLNGQPTGKRPCIVVGRSLRGISTAQSKSIGTCEYMLQYMR